MRQLPRLLAVAALGLLLGAGTAGPSQARLCDPCDAVADPHPAIVRVAPVRQHTKAIPASAAPQAGALIRAQR